MDNRFFSQKEDVFIVARGDELFEILKRLPDLSYVLENEDPELHEIFNNPIAPYVSCYWNQFPKIFNQQNVLLYIETKLIGSNRLSSRAAAIEMQ